MHRTSIASRQNTSYARLSNLPSSRRNVFLLAGLSGTSRVFLSDDTDIACNATAAIVPQASVVATIHFRQIAG